VLQSLKPDGSWMIIEPKAGDKLEDNLNPVGRIYYAGSTMGCVPTSLSREVGTALGAQAGEAKLREVITAGGFRNVRRAAETPFNMILEARPVVRQQPAPILTRCCRTTLFLDQDGLPNAAIVRTVPLSPAGRVRPGASGW
jgi:hypothetical protein